MSDPRTDLPSVKAPNFEQRVRETLMQYLGRQGNPLDRGLTLRDLIEGGIIKIRDGYNLRAGQPNVPIEPALPPEELDLTPPPQPTGFVVNSAISHVFIEHDAPLYRQGGGHLRTRVYGVTYTGGPLPVFTDAVEITQFTGTVHAHPSNPSTTWRLWIKWETRAGVLSATPAGGTNGLEVRTGEDVALLLEALQGKITESQLFNDLAERIDLIDGPANLPGTVAFQVAQEAEQRASQITTLTATVNTNNSSLTAAIQSESTARVSGDQALAGQINALQTSVNGNTTSIQTQQSTINGLSAQYTVKIDNNGYVSGFGLASTANNTTPFSDFAIRADRFYIANPAGPGVPPAMPFIVRTTPTTINGVSVPVGVYMRDAFIQNGTITNAKIANLAVDNAKIANVSVDKLTAGSIAVGQHIQSTGYIAGTQGWRINGNGNAELSNATVRGTVFATNGQFLGTLLGGSATSYTSGLGLFSGWTSGSSDANYRWRVGSPNGARIQWTGSAIEVYNGSNQLTLTSGGIDWSSVTNKPAFGIFATAPQLNQSNISTFIANAAIGTAQIGNAQITNAKIANAAVDNAKIANLAVDNAKIANAAVDNAKIANLAVDNAKIANLAVDNAKIADASITNAKIANLAVDNAKIANAAITTAKIGNAQVDTLQIAGNAVVLPVMATTGAFHLPGSSGGNTFHTVLSAFIDAEGGNVIVMGRADGIVFTTVPGAANCRILDPDGVVVANSRGAGTFPTTMGRSWKTGWYTLQAGSGVSSGTNCTGASLLLMGAKR